MASPEDVRARAVLRALEDRLVHGPHAALGISANANAAEIRHAFFELAKTYHPAKFARMAPEIQKQSNEVFLALRAAHDVLAKSARQASQQPMPPPQRPGTGAQPAVVAAPTTNARQTGGHAMQQPPPAHPSAARPTNAVPPLARPPGGTPPRGPGPSADSSQTMRRGTPASGVKVVRQGSPTTPPVTAPAPAAPAAAKPGAVPPDELAAVIDLVQKQKWDEARSALHGLAARAPSDSKIRALLAYTHGREAQLKGDVDEARVELMSALQIDPELQLAKTALGELFARRK